MTKSKVAELKSKPAKKIFPAPRVRRVGPYWQALNNVLDPELGIGIVDLGLVYDIEEESKQVTVTMTLTSIGCPVGPGIMRAVRTELETNTDAKGVAIKLVWEPPWDKNMIDPDLRAMLFN